MWTPLYTATAITVLCHIIAIATAQRDDLSRLKLKGISTEKLESITIDEVMNRLLPKQTKEAAAQLVMLPNNMVLAEYDMLLSQEQLGSLYGGGSGRSKRKAVKNTVFRWPNNVMPYQLLEGGTHLSNYDRYMFKVSLREWEKYTCVRFREKRPEDRDYVVVRDGVGCNSQLGKVGGAQDLNLDRNGCRFKGLYLHEVGHALGLVHEHQRPIRDGFIEIIKDNVEPSMRIWFNKYDRNAVEQYDVDYEYSSVMHYGITAFSKTVNGKRDFQTIRAKQPEREEEIGRVYQKELSFTDIKSINRMYNCDAHCDKNEKVCLNGGFLDQNCQCLCKDGTTNCEQGKVVDPSCKNSFDDWKCSIWAKQGECKSNAKFMLERCQKACGVCGDAFADSPELEGQCVDFFEPETCQKWKENSDCIQNEQFMRQNCKLTCGFCDNYAFIPGTNCENTYNSDEKCEGWANKGECAINPRWMPFNCEKACQTCPDNGTVVFNGGSGGSGTTRRIPITTARTVSTRRPVTLIPTTTTTLRPSPTTTTEPTGDRCENLHDNVNCELWARHDHCSINPGWMGPNCKKSCGLCKGGTGVAPSCKNNNPTCEVWAKYSQCVVNPRYMLENCQKACRTCSNEVKDRLQADQPAVDEVTASSNNPDNGGANLRSASVLITVFVCSILRQWLM